MNINRLEKIRLENCRRFEQEKSDGEDEKVKEEKPEDKQNNFYFKTKVISKIGTIINKLKGLIVFTEPNFTSKELFYIENTDNGGKAQSLLRFENRLVLALELLFALSSLVSIWLWTFLLILPKELTLPIELKILTIIIFCLEIIINFNTEKCDYNGEIITDRRAAVSFYFQKEFWLDFTGLISMLALTILGIAERGHLNE